MLSTFISQYLPPESSQHVFISYYCQFDVCASECILGMCFERVDIRHVESLTIPYFRLRDNSVHFHECSPLLGRYFYNMYTVTMFEIVFFL